MQFTVPKYIERDPKIVGPFSFKQFLYIGIAGAVSLILYFTTPLIVFIFSAVLLLGMGSALAFLQIEGRSLPVLIKDFFSFSSKPKVYVWGIKNIPLKSLKKEEKPKTEKEKEKPELSINRSRLKELSSQIETRTK